MPGRARYARRSDMTSGTGGCGIVAFGANEGPGLAALPPTGVNRGRTRLAITAGETGCHGRGSSTREGNYGDANGRSGTGSKRRDRAFTARISMGASAGDKRGVGGTRRRNKRGGTGRMYETDSGGGDRTRGDRHWSGADSCERGTYEFTGIRNWGRGGSLKNSWVESWSGNHAKWEIKGLLTYAKLRSRAVASI